MEADEPIIVPSTVEIESEIEIAEELAYLYDGTDYLWHCGGGSVG